MIYNSYADAYEDGWRWATGAEFHHARLRGARTLLVPKPTGGEGHVSSVQRWLPLLRSVEQHFSFEEEDETFFGALRHPAKHLKFALETMSFVRVYSFKSLYMEIDKDEEAAAALWTLLHNRLQDFSAMLQTARWVEDYAHRKLPCKIVRSRDFPR